jgi:hypothetical protein
MGVEAGFTICSYCGNRAVDEDEFCSHVKYHKGRVLPRINAKTGAHEDVLVYEKCHKLGFFELSFVFDPADETAVVSRVLHANHRTAQDYGPASLAEHQLAQQWLAEHPLAQQWLAEHQLAQEWLAEHPTASPGVIPEPEIPERQGRRRRAQQQQQQIPGELQEYYEMPSPALPSPMMPQASVGGPVMPPPPPNTRFPDEGFQLDERTGRRRHAYGEEEAPEDVDTLRDDDDAHDGDFKHYVESPKELRGPDLDMSQRLDRAQEEEGLDVDRRVEDVEEVGGPPMPSRNARRKRRVPARRRRYAGEHDWDYDDYGNALGPRAESRHEDYSEPPYRGHPGDYPPQRRGRMSNVLIDPRTGRRYYAAEDFPPDDGGPPPDDGGGDLPPWLQGDQGDGGPPPDEDEDDFGDEDEGDEGDGGPPPDESDEDLISEAEEDLERAEEEEGGGDEEEGPEDEGEGDYGPEGEEDEEPEDHGGEIPPQFLGRHGNYRSSHQKKRRARRGRAMSLAQRSRVASVGRRVHYADDSGHTDGGPYDENNQGDQEEVFISDTPGAEAVAVPTPGDGTISNTENNLVARIRRRSNELRRDVIAYEQITGRRITADEAVETPDEVHPSVNTGPGGQEAANSGDFESLDLDDKETQPGGTTASLAPFQAFNTWLYNTTGRTANQHPNALFLRRQAARFCQASGYSVESLFPALGMVLREARMNEGRTAMRRRADESLEVAAPQDRIDVEAPVRDTTDADAQASQFDLGDFGDNAGDSLADPNLDTDSQIWAPDETPAGFDKGGSNRKADGILAVRYAEAFIQAGLAPNTPEEKWKIAGLAQTMRHGTIVDRTRLLDAVNTVHQASRRRTAGVSGAGRGIPQGFGGRRITAGNGAGAASDIATDSAIFLK